MTDPLQMVTLDNGVRVSFFDQSNRYFGDFHRLCIRILIELPLAFALPAGMSQEKARLERTLERMGVPTARLEIERQALIASFLQSSSQYLGKPGFPQQMLNKIKSEEKKTTTLLFNR